MKSKRFQYAYRKNASKLHKLVGDTLRSSGALGMHKIYQEYPVNKINPDFQSGREKFDWVILSLAVVIECHGEQHYQPINFGGISDEEAIDNFHAQKHRDEEKELAAREAGFGYIVIRYDDEVSEEIITELVQKNIGAGSSSKGTRFSYDWKSKYQAHKEYLEENNIAQERRERAKRYRKERYRRAKEWKQQGGNDDDTLY